MPAVVQAAIQERNRIVVGHPPICSLFILFIHQSLDHMLIIKILEDDIGLVGLWHRSFSFVKGHAAAHATPRADLHAATLKAAASTAYVRRPDGIVFVEGVERS